MASMVNRPLASHFTIDVTWQSSLLWGIPFLVYLFTAFVWLAYHTAHRLPCTRWAGLTGRHLLEFKYHFLSTGS